MGAVMFLTIFVGVGIIVLAVIAFLVTRCSDDEEPVIWEDHNDEVLGIDRDGWLVCVVRQVEGGFEAQLESGSVVRAADLETVKLMVELQAPKIPAIGH